MKIQLKPNKIRNHHHFEPQNQVQKGAIKEQLTIFSLIFIAFKNCVDGRSVNDLLLHFGIKF
jgi:hypothetical protein